MLGIKREALLVSEDILIFCEMEEGKSNADKAIVVE